MGGEKSGDARHEIVVAIDIGPKDHVAVIVALQIGDLAQQGDGVIAGDEAFNLPCGGDFVLFDLMALGRSSRMAGLPFGEVGGHPHALGDLLKDARRLARQIGGKFGLRHEGLARQMVEGAVVQAHPIAGKTIPRIVF